MRIKGKLTWLSRQWRWLHQIILDLLFDEGALAWQLRAMSPAEFRRHLEYCNNEPDQVRVFTKYQHPFVKDTIKLLKYLKNADAARIWGALLFEEIAGDIEEGGVLSGRPLLIPIPASKERLRRYGYNQLHLVLDEVRRLDDSSQLFDIEKRALRRLYETPAQTSFERRADRLENAKDIFNASGESVAGRQCIVIDDVTTTGATLRDARRALKEAGARSVRCIALAH